MSSQLLAPGPGTLHPLSACSDPVFAGEILGPGVLIRPEQAPTTVVSPVAGRLLKVMPHAFVVAGEVAVLVHLGINTVRLEGRGFELLAAQGDTVEAGQPVIAWDPSTITDEGMTDEVPVVVMEREAGSLPEVEDGRQVAAGEVLLTLD